jgi:hypothetical protein
LNLLENVIEGSLFEFTKKHKKAEILGIKGVDLKVLMFCMGKHGWGCCILVEKDRWFISVDGLTRPLTIGIQTKLYGSGFNQGSLGKDDQVINKRQVDKGRAISDYFNPYEITKGFLFVSSLKITSKPIIKRKCERGLLVWDLWQGRRIRMGCHLWG